MQTKKRVRMAVDIAMTVLSVVLMGGTILFPEDGVHKMLGALLVALWAFHTALNRSWYRSLFCGTYSPYRILQAAVNLALLLCALLLALSGIALCTWFPAQNFLGVARIVHLVASHWYYIFMCAHLGLHANMILMQIQAKRKTPLKEKKSRRILSRIILAAVCAYGVYAFIRRKIPLYLFLREQFFFFDIERGYILFAADYLSILVLFATAFSVLGNALKQNHTPR